MRPRPWVGWALALTLLAAASRPALASHAQHPPEAAEFNCSGAARFSPHGGAEALVVETLAHARASVHIAIYGLTSRKIEQTLLDLAQAGVRVSIKVDHLQSAGRTQAALLARLRVKGIEVEVSRLGRLLHDKFAIVDGRWVVTGSFNWTDGAEHRNRENILAFDCPDLAKVFEAEWETIHPNAP
jgi:phosphatidylserine/phosphatidylglycerophosphate/cardiolipin synthase-like enzyme